MMREALIDLGAISGNVENLRAAVGGMTSMVVVKANGYGHGATQSARAAVAGGADWLGVVDIDEALELRAAGIQTPVLAWLHDPDQDFAEAIAARIDLGVSYLEQLDRVAAASGTGQIHLKVDTGLGRNGAAPGDWAALFDAAAAHERAGRIVVRGIFSHLAGVSDTDQVASFEQALAEAAATGLTPELVHLAASGAALDVPNSRFDMVRFGVAAYGLSPYSGGSHPAVSLTPAMQLSGAVVSAKRVKAGTGVSYGHEHVVPRDTTLALIPLGYGDGIPRHGSGAGPISIKGKRYTVAGRVAMDQVVVDVGDDDVAVGDRAIFFGDPATGVPSADDWAEACGTINYEIVTRIGNRVVRRYTS
ncbi:alanine racemase [Salinibacterium sp. G-O1]|uniref:alanine racemase n=1 Tax=Salinibacterium sp. G-O1 TaxID=3046208 RepID=UPI0024BB8D6C|nr:alanine racemase [Salinibacterium sp. G-O1]MDJ0334191.1 alanine racemase [Salinibacterium sp. G-O1]